MTHLIRNRCPGSTLGRGNGLIVNTFTFHAAASCYRAMRRGGLHPPAARLRLWSLLYATRLYPPDFTGVKPR